jgi:LETM1 and EF-hand domain-containing protein 1
MQFSKLFENELTLDNLPRPQLIAMCRFLQLAPYGPDAFLRFSLRNKLRDIQRDDGLLAAQGIETLDEEELESALRTRGMNHTGTLKEKRKALKVRPAGRLHDGDGGGPDLCVCVCRAGWT